MRPLLAIENDMDKNFCDSACGDAAVIKPPPSALHDEAEIVRTLGRGGYSTVTLGRSRRGGNLFAIKAMKRSQKGVEEMFFNEICIFNRLGCGSNFIVHYMDSFVDQETFGLILEYVSGGSLYEEVVKQNGLLEEQARFYVAEIVCGLEFIHDRKIIHRDIKTNNIMVDKQGHIKIVDFGISKYAPQGRTSTPIGPLQSRAPEIVREQEYTFSVDIYALGIALYQMINVLLPFWQSYTRDDIEVDILCAEVPHLDELSPSGQGFLKWLMKRDPAERPETVSDFLDHEWFEGINWDLMRARACPSPQVRKPVPAPPVPCYSW